jgi:L-alanine-DL-glutamate epimerase-like enolase superfamily enzyme
MLGFSTEPARAAERSIEYVEQGFSALKWYLPHNALDGDDGLANNVALIRAVREAVGPDVDIMVDWLLSDPRVNSVLYAVKLARRLEEYRPTWIEEPLNFDDLDAHRRLAAATSIPLAFGEHYYTRWQIKDAIERGGATILQPDPNAAGGITELRRRLDLRRDRRAPRQRILPQQPALPLRPARTHLPAGGMGRAPQPRRAVLLDRLLPARPRVLPPPRRPRLRLRPRPRQDRPPRRAVALARPR